MKISVSDYEDYLYDHYKEHGIDTSLFMKLVEEVGEVAEVLNKRDGRKASDSEDLKSQLANELVDVIHYAFAIASLNEIDLNDVILEKDKKAAIKYNHERNLEQFMLERQIDFVKQLDKLEFSGECKVKLSLKTNAIKSFGKTVENDIKSLEKVLNIKFPNDYKDFLLKTNGGSIPNDNTNEIVLKNIKKIINIDILYGVNWSYVKIQYKLKWGKPHFNLY